MHAWFLTLTKYSTILIHSFNCLPRQIINETIFPMVRSFVSRFINDCNYSQSQKTLYTEEDSSLNL